MECDEIITNPICADCLASRMKLFVEEHDPVMAARVEGFSGGEGGTLCILCGKGISLCAHCFSRDIHDLIQERSPELAAEFASRFDFNLRGEVAAFA